MTRQERLTKMIEQGYNNGWAWSDIAKRIVEIEAMTPKLKSGPDPLAAFAESVAVGFPVARTDGLVSLHLGGTYTLLSKAEALRLSSDLFMAGRDSPQTGCVERLHGRNGEQPDNWHRRKDDR